MSEIVIIGNGPAALSAAIYGARGGASVTVLGAGTGSLHKADKIENYFGFADPITGEELLEIGKNQCLRLGVSFVEEEAVGVSFGEKLSIKTATGRELPGDATIIATGVSRKKAGIQGLESFEGSGVSYCAVCDGFFFRGKPVAVLGAGEYAVNEAEELLPIAGSVTILTNGVKLQGKLPAGAVLRQEKIAKLTGGMSLENVKFEDGSEIPAAGLFVALGTAGGADFAKKLGIETEGNKILVNEKMETNLPGVYAAGDCTGGWLQVAKAVHQGAIAGSEAVRFLRSK